ncbi:DUF4394 domain-containing protein [Candidatus Cyanaurora vandensis]|uniref:DUF4394 domain-containing protein n=1 Tax=Candidatus Cyanaurora vandensis TaxID=2714958 RepID=UPI00257A537D|nr:DUF4394 domain-containing protein [Candidatus Cyanaurora vandensis]
MQLNKLSALLLGLVITSAATAQVQAAEAELIGLNNNNTLVRFLSSSPQSMVKVTVTGLSGTLIGIDYRPADGQLYGITDSSKLYTINVRRGTATFVANLTVPFSGGATAGTDFNPVADRLRVVGSNEQNYRIAVATTTTVTAGATTVDLPLVYAPANIPAEANAGKDPSVTAAGYTNSIAGATTTKLYNIDGGLDILVLQNPPNDGALTTVGALGVDFGTTGGFDIFLDEEGINSAFAVSGSTLYAIDLATGKANLKGTVGRDADNLDLIGLAVRKAVNP